MGKKKTGTTRSKKPKKAPTEIKKREGPLPYIAPARDKVVCPACGKKIVWEKTDEIEKGWTPCDPQLRIVIFDIPNNNPMALPEDQVVKGIEVGTGKYVCGRCVNNREKLYFKTNKTLDGLVSWCMARVSHFETCERWDRWLSGEAKYPDVIPVEQE